VNLSGELLLRVFGAIVAGVFEWVFFGGFVPGLGVTDFFFEFFGGQMRLVKGGASWVDKVFRVFLSRHAG
jgi:hypothetical protein